MGPDASLIDAIAVTEPRKASLYFDIKRNTLDDGPGIRSVVFFKGCPLSCTWCQNPESINTGYELSYDAEKCISCHDCADACPEQAIDLSSPDKIIRDKCTQCFKCVDVCPSGALERCGNDIDMDHLVEKVLEDEAFFEASGGGVTVSGGEALMQMDSVGELFSRLKQRNVHTLIQTAGLFNYKVFENLVLPYTDTIYFDLKLMDSDAHKQYCGVPNHSIHENFRINGPPPPGYAMNVRANHHDFGTYYTLTLTLPANPADDNEGYEAAIETGLGHWHEAVMSPPIDYRDHEHPKPRHPTRAANESIIGAVLSTRPYPDGRFAIPIFETIHNNLTKAYPDLASAARLRLEDPEDQHAATLH